MSDPPPDETERPTPGASKSAGQSEEYQRWLTEAEAELVVIDVLRTDSRVPARVVCFHAHLAAEKALKAVVILRSVTLQRTHDLARLLQLLPFADAERFERVDLVLLNPWSIAGRYPADIDDPDDAEVDLIAAAARNTVIAALVICGR